MTTKKNEDSAELLHKLRMEELKYVRETERLKHEWELERQRIKSAEIRKTYERKANQKFAESTRY